MNILYALELAVMSLPFQVMPQYLFAKSIYDNSLR